MEHARSCVKRSALPLMAKLTQKRHCSPPRSFPFDEELDGLTNVAYCWTANGNFLTAASSWAAGEYRFIRVKICRFEGQITEEAVEASLQEIVARPAGYEVLERRPYRVHKRIAPHYYRERVGNLAGDAAPSQQPLAVAWG